MTGALLGFAILVVMGAVVVVLYLVARDGVGDIAGILPLNRIASPLFGRALVSSGFAVDGGILATDWATIEALAGECWSRAGMLGCTTAELRGGELAVRRCGCEISQVQQLVGEVRDQRVRSRIGQHPLHLLFQYDRIAKAIL